MRIVTVVLPVLLTLAGCVSRMGPPTIPVASQPPASSPMAGECDTTDITVTAGIDEQPVVTLPTYCEPPSVLLVRDVIPGDGPQAVPGADLEVGYEMITWTDGAVLDSTWSGNNNLPLKLTNLGDSGWINGWDEGLPGIREGGRRLLVVPPESDTGGTVVYVIDAVRVS
jgi:peptidylprolyl isomerase